jgi:hypothetical protein
MKKKRLRLIKKAQQQISKPGELSPRLCHICRQPRHYRHNCPNLPRQDQHLGVAKCAHGENPIFQGKPDRLNYMGNTSMHELFPTSSCNFESRVEILLKGGRLWCPRFLINVINANDRISWVKLTEHWSNLGWPGSSPRKPRQWTL